MHQRDTNYVIMINQKAENKDTDMKTKLGKLSLTDIIIIIATFMLITNKSADTDARS